MNGWCGPEIRVPGRDLGLKSRDAEIGCVDVLYMNVGGSAV